MHHIGYALLSAFLDGHPPGAPLYMVTVEEQGELFKHSSAHLSDIKDGLGRYFRFELARTPVHATPEDQRNTTARLQSAERALKAIAQARGIAIEPAMVSLVKDTRTLAGTPDLLAFDLQSGEYSPASAPSATNGERPTGT